MRRQQDRAARRLVDAARLHADEAVLDQVEPADAVVVAELVERWPAASPATAPAPSMRQRRPSRSRCGPRSACRARPSARSCADRRSRRRFLGRVLQHLALGGRVQQVGVDRERRLAFLVLGDRDLVLARELQQVLAALERPLAPRRDDLDAGLERVIGELEAHLVVALAGRAVTDGVGADLARDLDLLLGDQRPRDRGAEQVLRPRRARWRGTSGTRSRGRIPRAGPR